MTIVDDRGRLFGRFNVIDAGLVIVVLVLVPLAYGAYRLFRPEPMEIVSVTPAQVAAGQKPRIRLKGHHLRPYLRAQVGPAQPHLFLIETPEDGEFELPELPPGTYDVTLYDEVQQVARMSRAITIAPPVAAPRVRLQLRGAFFGLDDAAAKSIVKGKTYPDASNAPIEVIEAGMPRDDVRRVRPSANSEAIMDVPVPGSFQVPATLRAVCLPGGERQNCAVNGAVVTPGGTIPISAGLSFVIDAVRADVPAAPLTVRVELVARPEVIDLIAAGDVDLSVGGDGRIVSVANRQTRAGQVSRQISSNAVVETATTPERLASVEAVVRLTADQTPAGLSYRSTPLKPGALFSFETSRYAVRGAVISVAGGGGSPK